MTDDPRFKHVGRCIRRMGSKYHGEMAGAVVALQRVLEEAKSSPEDLAAWIESWVAYEMMNVIPVVERVAGEIMEEVDEVERVEAQRLWDAGVARREAEEAALGPVFS